MKNYDNDPAFKEFISHEKESASQTPRPAAHAPTIRVHTRSPLQFYTGCAIIGALLVVVNTLIISAPVLADAAQNPDFYWGLVRFGAAGAVTVCLMGAFTRLCRQC